MKRVKIMRVLFENGKIEEFEYKNKRGMMKTIKAFPKLMASDEHGKPVKIVETYTMSEKK